MIGITHSKDLDGYSSGAIILKKYPNAEMYGYDYGEPFNIDVTDKDVIMADVSLPITEMYELSKKARSFTWIDHHTTIIQDYYDFVGDSYHFCNAILENGIAACEITWKHLFPNIEMPLAIKLLGEYDTWRNNDIDRWNDMTLPFQYGMRLDCNSIETFPMNILEDNALVRKKIEIGKNILKYQSTVNERDCMLGAFEYKFENYRAICLNTRNFNSMTFESLYDENIHDIMMPFAYNSKSKQWAISIYTTKNDVNCSALAKVQGGGGHRQVAGFQTSDITKIFKNLK